MIRRGRQEGWLTLPRSRQQLWAEQHGVRFDGVKLGQVPGREDQGFAVIATRDIPTEHEAPLIVVPRDLVLSRQRCLEVANTDLHLRSIFDALGEFVQTPRGAILVFLLHQVTLANPRAQIPGRNALESPYIDYVKLLPQESLPTLWTKEERDLLVGTTLRPAIEAKLRSLLKEFETLRERTNQIAYCVENWWSNANGLGLSFGDWLQVDVMYRSRALEYPGIGDAMAPCIDMSNHAANEETIALYEIDDSDSETRDDSRANSVLVMRHTKSLRTGQEVTITYGDKKGACEMAFSYGFIERSMPSARELFLNLPMQEDDPLAPAKMHLARVAPGVRVFENVDGSVDWESPYVWLISVNEEDGFKIRVVDVNGEKVLKAYWKDAELPNVDNIRALLVDTELWEVYQLRAAAGISGRVDAQLQLLRESAAASNTSHGAGTNIRHHNFALAMQLRALEGNLLHKMSLKLQAECNRLLALEVVQHYLQASSSADSTGAPDDE